VNGWHWPEWLEKLPVWNPQNLHLSGSISKWTSDGSVADAASHIRTTEKLAE
jgi:hypothetical protein